MIKLALKLRHDIEVADLKNQDDHLAKTRFDNSMHYKEKVLTSIENLVQNESISSNS